MLQPPLPLSCSCYGTTHSQRQMTVKASPFSIKVNVRFFQTGSSQTAKRDVRWKCSDKVLWETDAAAEDDEEAEGGRTQSACFLSSETPNELKKIVSLLCLLNFIWILVSADDKNVGSAGGLLGERRVQV